MNRLHSKRRRIPLGVRTGGSTALIALAFAITMASYFPGRQSATAERGLENKAKVAVQMVAEGVTTALEFDDLDTLNESLGYLAVDDDFLFSAIYDEQAQLITQRVAEGATSSVSDSLLSEATQPRPNSPQLTSTPRALFVSYPVTTKAGRAATIVAGFSYERIRQDSATARNQILLLALLLMVAGVGLASLIGWSISRRVRRVVATAQRVASGAIISEQIEDGTDDEIGDITESFNELNRNLERMAAQVSEVANGNLTETVDLEGDLATAFNRMVNNQRELVQQISGTATQLNASSGQFFANAKQQEQGATSQSGAVDEVRKTLGTLLQSAREIGSTAEDVLRSAERSQSNSQKVAERIATLSSHNRRIAEILEVIKDIANKSELLALNAGLEGTKAGEAGRGFSLVAAQMQRLAENVMGAVRDIKELTATITDSTDSTVLATEESTKLATDTTRWARQIGLIIQEQQTGTEQATGAMEDVGQVASQTVSGSRQIVDSATDLMNLSQTLQALVGKFRVSKAAVVPSSVQHGGE